MSRKLLIVMLFSVSAAAQTARKGKPEPGAYFYADKTSFSATGKWIPSDPGDKPAYPTETQLDCFKSMMQCVEGTADYYMGYPHIMLNYLDVVKWDDNGIIANSNAGICMTNTLVISFADKTLSATDSMKKLPDKQRGACNSLGAEKTAHSVFILRNSERWNKDREDEFLGKKPKS